MLALLFVSLLLLSYLLTGAVRRYALSRSVLDVPNERSSHKVPTPRGGGLAIVLTLPLVLGWGYSQQVLSAVEVIALFVGAAAIAVLGFVDDHRPLSAKLRFSVQLFAALLSLVMLPTLPDLSLLGWSLPLSTWALPLLLFALVWLTNLYNFMDGIDGIASIQAISVLLSAAGLLWLLDDSQYALLLMLLSAPILGFLIWNFPPAKIFMGDVCSAPLGLLLGIIAAWLSAVTELNLWSWLILMAVFLVDATWTLLVRMLSGQRWSQPHRSHSYQILSRRWQSHKKVSLSVLAVNVVWLLPMAWLAQRYEAFGVLIFTLAILPLVVICQRLGAGRNNN